MSQNLDLKALQSSVIQLFSEIDFLLPIISLNEIEQSVKEKGKTNFVTKYDVKIEEFLKENLLKLLPGSSFYGEETGRKIGDDFTWIVDPIDGTTNFIHGLPFACSIGLVNDGETVLGIVYNMVTKDIYSAIQGNGAFKNGFPIQASNRKEISNSVLAFGFPYDTTKTKDILQKVLNVKTEGAADIKRIGPAALDICYVAEGKLDGYFEHDLQPWDIAAGILILEESGGSLVKMNGEKITCEKSSIIATNCSAELQKALIKILNQ